MKRLLAASAMLIVGFAPCLAEGPVPKFKTHQLSDKFYCEGAYFADFNKDGNLDVVSGPFWYEGPEFQERYEVRPPKPYDPKRYSDNFLTFTDDFNADGWPDIFFVPFPGKEGFWYENPAGKNTAWRQHLAFDSVENESPMWGDVNGDGRSDLAFNARGCLGYATYDPDKPYEPWTFHPITPKGNYHKFSHGVGFGDVNGDGRTDMLDGGGWWERPADAKVGQTWAKHPFKFADAACQMFVYDVDGDGLSDVITSWHCHRYGLVWYKQVKGQQGDIAWEQQVIMPPNPDMGSDELRVSQLHAIELVDMNGDGLKDILTGKRYWAHGPTGDVEPNAPAIVMWFQLCRDSVNGVEFIPHIIDDDSGVGTQVAAADLNGDGTPDVIVGNKKGTYIHLSQNAE